MRTYKWNKYGFKISIEVEVPDVVNTVVDYMGKSYGKMNLDYHKEFDYLGSFNELYYDENQFMYPSLFTYAIEDILNIDYLMWLSTCKHP